MQAPDDFNPEIGAAEQLMPGLRRILAPNPSPMTYRGTNTYLLGGRDIAVIDPGPDNPAHLEAILAASRKGRITHIFVTHAHLDHSPLARPLAEETGAPVYAFGPATAGRSAIMADLAASGHIGGGEGVDMAFEPDEVLPDGARVSAHGWSLNAIHTPGHIGNHMCYAWSNACFTGDHVMGWASSLVSPPDGDLTDFMASCRKLAERNWRIFYPGHGAPIQTPASRLDWLVSHRNKREQAILKELENGAATSRELAERIYADTHANLLKAAERNVLAHLVDLVQRKRAVCDGPLRFGATFGLSDP